MLADALRRQGVPREVLILPDEVHDFLLWRSWRNTYDASAKFLSRQLPLQ
jgi:dipeptidyl aminopeptidase/acylaminoacyl peptidase